MQQVVGNKKTFLFKEMMVDIGYDDVAVADLLVTGKKVVGNLPKIGIWKPDDRRAKMTIGAILRNAAEAKRDVQK